MEQNPYAAPKARVADEEVIVPMEPASRGQRFVNFLIDLVAYFALSLVVGIAVAIIYPPFIESTSVLADYVFGYLVMGSYYVVCEALFGRTLGKLVTRTWVVDEADERPTFLRIIGRTLARFIPFEAFSFFGQEASGWHDQLSGTRVVRKARTAA